MYIYIHVYDICMYDYNTHIKYKTKHTRMYIYIRVYDICMYDYNTHVKDTTNTDVPSTRGRPAR